jgi:hypothetical protein
MQRGRSAYCDALRRFLNCAQFASGSRRLVTLPAPPEVRHGQAKAHDKAAEETSLAYRDYFGDTCVNRLLLRLQCQPRGAQAIEELHRM